MPYDTQRLDEALTDRYHIVRELGAGGMGAVYLAEDRKLSRSVAIKVLDPELSASVTGDRFLKEIRIAAGLTHPHIIPLHDSGEASGLLYYVMPFEEGESLRALMEREGPLPLVRALTIARDVADGLEHAHAHGVIHRDIKPANILLVGEHAVIADFGVARAVEVATTHDSSVTTTAVGTPLYMSPEQASGSKHLDGRSDIYSVGCVLYEMLTGKPPFRGRSTAAVLAGHVHRDAPSIRDIRPDVPTPVDAVARRALAKSPEERFQTATELCRALEAVLVDVEGTWPAVSRRWRRLGPRVRRRTVVAGLAAMGILAATLVSLAIPTAQPAGEGVSQSLVVLPFRLNPLTPGQATALVEVADEVTVQLNRWESVRAVSQIALSGPRLDEGIADPVLERLGQGLAVARRVGARTAVVLRLRPHGDTTRVEATLFDVATGAPVGRPIESAGSLDDPFSLAEGIAAGILGLEGPTSGIEKLRRRSANPDALNEYQRGRRLLERWRLAEAAEHFREATRLDSAFAMAHYQLALTLYWQGARDVAGLQSVGPDIARRSRLAITHAAGLPVGDSLHIAAFFAFQAGDYDGARTLYHTLLQRDSTDVYAWLLQGIVEYRDPWLTVDGHGGYVPRSNLNVALRSFRETVRLSPGFHLGYGHLFDIAQDVAQTADRGAAPGFAPSSGVFQAPWAPDTPHGKIPFYPIYRDSIEWLSDAQWRALPADAAARGAYGLLESSLATLRRWAAFAPGEARPHEELATWTLALRERLRGPVPPQRLDSLAKEAFTHAREALDLAGPVSRATLFRIASLQLAVGRTGAAGALVDSLLRAAPSAVDEPTPPTATNVLLFEGQPARALALMESEPEPRRRYYPDPSSGELIDDGGAERVIARLRVLGATGTGGSGLDAAFVELRNRWAPAPGRTREQSWILRRMTAARIAPALALDPHTMDAWNDSLGLEDPLWTALRPDAPDRRGALDAALQTSAPEVQDPDRAYLLGRVALELGDNLRAARLFSRLDSLAYSVEGRDCGWGLLALSYLYRARSYDALDERDQAVRYYSKFVEAWTMPDASPGLTDTARRRLEALQARGAP